LEPLRLIVGDVAKYLAAVFDLAGQADRACVEQRGVEHAGG
jgi:hypothetical protein